MNGRWMCTFRIAGAGAAGNLAPTRRILPQVAGRGHYSSRKVITAIKDYRTSMDDLGRFLNDQCVHIVKGEGPSRGSFRRIREVGQNQRDQEAVDQHPLRPGNARTWDPTGIQWRTYTVD